MSKNSKCPKCGHDTITVFNNNPAYGYKGPYEVESFEDLADEMENCFVTWACEHVLQLEGDDAPKSGVEENEFIVREMARMRAEFIKGLEVCK